jgi:hypothetical protein
MSLIYSVNTDRNINSYSKSQILRNAYKKMFRESNSRYHLTLTFKFGVNVRVAENLLNDFLVYVNRYIFKGRYKKSGQALKGFVVKEMTPSMQSCHFHIIISDPEGRLPDLDRMEEIIGKKIENVNRKETSLNQIGRHLLQNYYEGNLEQYLTKIFERTDLTNQEKMKAISPLDSASVSFH